MDRTPTIVFVLFIFVFVNFAALAYALRKIDKKLDRIIELQEKHLELLEQPEVVVSPPMSGAEDERQSLYTEQFQEDMK